MIKIRDVIAQPGQVSEERVSRSGVVSGHYGYMLSGAALDCQPFGNAASEIESGVVESYAATGPISTLDPLLFSCDAALIAAETLLERQAEPCLPLGLIYCHADIDEGNEWLPATMIAKRLQLIDPLCFSVSEVSHCAVFYALKLIAGQMAMYEELASTLIVTGDKWIYPFFRGFGEFGMVGDGAGALLLNRSDGEGVNLIHVCVAPAEPSLSPFSGSAPCLDHDVVAKRIIEFLHSALAEADLAPRNVDLLLSPAAPALVVRDVSAAFDAKSYSDRIGRRVGHLSTTDPLQMLEGHWDEVRVAGQISLWWSIGLNGELACAILHGAGEG